MGALPTELTSAQGLLVAQEADSARYLLRDSVETIKRMRYRDVSLHTALTTGSIGVEKMLKLALGLSTMAGGDGWPTKQTMRRYNHNSVAIYVDVRTAIEAGVRFHGANGYATELIAKVDADPLLPMLMEMMSVYGREGRFFFLDALAEDPQAGDSPSRMWDDLDRAVIAARPDLDGHDFSPDAMDLQSLAIADDIAATLLRFWNMIATVLMHGVLGAAGKPFGADLRPKSAYEMHH